MRFSPSTSRPGWGALITSTLLVTSTLAFSPDRMKTNQLKAKLHRNLLAKRQMATPTIELPEGAVILDELPEGATIVDELPEGATVIDDLPEGAFPSGIPEGEMPDGGMMLPPIPKANYVELPLDYADKNNKKTFKNRYWINDSAYKPGGPVIFYDIGEIPGEMSQGLMNGQQKFFMGVANKTDALIVLFEHRFYGESMPELTDAVSKPKGRAEFFKPLTIENALEDIVTFAKQFKYKNETVSPGQVPWIFMGASYPGARSAWIRQRNPEIIYAALADSAVVAQQKEYPHFYEVIEEALEQQWPNCTADARAIATWMNDIYTKQDQPAYDDFLHGIGAYPNSTLLNHFNTLGNIQEGYWEMARSVFKYTTDLLYNSFQPMGFTEEDNIVAVCKHIQDHAIKKAPEKKDIIGTDGVIAALGEEAGKKLIYAGIKKSWALYMGMMQGMPPGPSSNDIRAGCNAGDLEMCKMLLSGQAWFWQQCTDMGNIATSGNAKIVPAYNTLSKQLQDCAFAFGDAVRNGPGNAAQKYGGLSMNPSNTFWSNGEWDTSLHLTPNSPKSGRTATQTIPRANQPPPADTYFGSTSNGSFHSPHIGCEVFLTSDESEIDVNATQAYMEGYEPCNVEVTNTQQLFLDALDVWLPEFKTHALPGGDGGYTLPGGPGGVYDSGTSFVFPGLFGGTHTIRISHPTWKTSKLRKGLRKLLGLAQRDLSAEVPGKFRVRRA